MKEVEILITKLIGVLAICFCSFNPLKLQDILLLLLVVTKLLLASRNYPLMSQ